MNTLDTLESRLKPGKTYRRADLSLFSKSVDRHLQVLVQNGTLRKLSAGLYYCPSSSVFGEVPPSEDDLIRTFLKDDRFLVTSPNFYNALGVGTTQLYNKRVIYNHKRHGKFKFGGRTFEFQIKHHFPLAMSEEFLLVDLVNNIEMLAEDQNAVLMRVRRRALIMNKARLKRAIRQFANGATRKFFEEALLDAA